MMDKRKWKNELAYLWTDYKWFLLAGLIAAVIAFHFLVSAFTQKETIINVMLIDCHASVGSESMASDYLKAAGLDPKNHQTEILTSLMFSESGSGAYTMTSLSRFMTDIGNEKLDVAGMLEEDFVKYDKSGTWADLTEYLGEEKLALLSDKLLEKDGRVIGVFADGLPRLKQYGCYEDSGIRGVLGVVYNTKHRDEAARYLEFLALDPGT